MERDRGPAATWAGGCRSWSRLDWWRLEARAFDGHPRVHRALTFFAPVGAWHDLDRPPGRELPGWVGVLLLPVWVASLTLPVVTVVLLLRSLLDGTAPVAVHLAGAVAAGAGTIVAVSVLQDLRDPEGPTSNGTRLVGLLHLVPSSLACVLTVVAVALSRARGSYGLVGLLADAAVGAAAVWLHAGSPRAAHRWARIKQRRLARALDTLPVAERDAIRRDIEAALDDLAARGHLDAAPAERARSLPLGALGRTLAAREELTAVRGDR